MKGCVYLLVLLLCISSVQCSAMKIQHNVASLSSSYSPFSLISASPSGTIPQGKISLDGLSGGNILYLYDYENDVAQTYNAVNIIGGVRGEKLEGYFSGQDAFSLVFNGTMTVNIPYSGYDVYCIIKYDGSNNGFFLDPTGLGNKDFTKYSGLYITGQSMTSVPVASISIFTKSGTCTWVTPVYINTNYIPFNWFSGYNSCDYSNVGAIQITYALDNAGYFQISDFGVYYASSNYNTPAPSTYPTNFVSVTALPSLSSSSSASASGSFINATQSMTPYPSTSSYYSTSSSVSSSSTESPTSSLSSRSSPSCTSSVSKIYFSSSSLSPTLSPSRSVSPSKGSIPSSTPTGTLSHGASHSRTESSSYSTSPTGSLSYYSSPSSSRTVSYGYSPSPSKAITYTDIEVVDSFSDSLNTLTVVAQSAQKNVIGVTNSSNIIGGQRDVLLTAQSGLEGTVFVAGVNSGLFFSSAPYSGYGTASIKYDGNNTSTYVNEFGLEGIDFTCGGLCNAMRIETQGIYVEVYVSVFTFNQNSGDQNCVYNLGVPPTSMGSLFVQYNSYCDWTSVGAIELSFNLQGAGNIEVNEITLCNY